jgi:hypothetical protein
LAGISSSRISEGHERIHVEGLGSRAVNSPNEP